MLEKRAARTVYVGFRATKDEAKAMALHAKRKRKTTISALMRRLYKHDMEKK